MLRDHKKILLFFCLCFVLSSCLVFADDAEDISEPVQNDNNTSAPLVVDITQLLNKDTNKTSTEDPDTVYILEPELISAETKSQKITAADATGLKAVMLSLIGDYETTVTDYTYQSGSSGYYTHSINIERDWSWICSCGVFAIVLYCTFKAIGGFLWRV